jgi:hypothetical protein
MAKLAAVVDALDTVPESAREFYTKSQDGKFRLDSDHEDVSGLKNNRDDLRRENQKLKDQYKAFEGLDPEQVKAAIKASKEVEEQKARAAGEFDKLKAQMVAEHEKAIAKANERIERITRAATKREGENAARRALEGKATSVDLMLPHVLRYVKVEEDEASGEFRTVILDEDLATPLVVGAKGDPASFDDLIARMRKDKRYSAGFLAEGGRGSGAQPPGGGGPSTVRSRADLKDTAAKTKFIGEHGLAAFKALPAS